MKQVGGIIPYLPTPVDDKGNIIEESVSALVSHLADCGVSGICVLGSVGEFPYLLPEQKRALVNAAVKAGHASGLDVVAGVAGFSVRDLIEQSELYSSIGVDALVLMIEQYFPLSVKQLASMIIEVGNNIPDKEIILYSNPKYMHYSFPIELFENINGCSNIDGYKDASGNTGFLLSIKERYGDRFRIFSASAHIPLFVFELGGVGWMAGPACIVPKSSVRLFGLAKEGRLDEALALQRRMWAVNAAFAKYDLAACIKGVLNAQGYDFGNPVPPLEALPADTAMRLSELAASLEEGGMV